VSLPKPRWFLLLWLLAGCTQKPRGPGLGQITMRWEGSREGSLSGPATAGWCSVLRVLEIRSIRGDTGVALALHPGETLAMGSYRIVEPARAESVPPAAGVAVRWLSQNLVQGFQGDSGRLDLERSSSGGLSGRVHARAHSVVDTQRIVLTGSFRDLMPAPDSLGCAPADTTEDDPESSDTNEPASTDVD